jgi:enamine deaminase RidA (YjgF/YER057c/UK114 family)
MLASGGDSPDWTDCGCTVWRHFERNYAVRDEVSQPRRVEQTSRIYTRGRYRAGKLVYISGQVAWDAKGEIVGKGNFRVQVTKALENLKIALTAAGATMEDLIKVNYYVVNLKPDQVPIIREVRSKYFFAEHPPASTLVGVTALAREDFMIEIEAIAVVK